MTALPGLTSPDVQLLLDAVQAKHSPNGGYSEDPSVARLQGKLSAALQAAREEEGV